MNLKTSLSSNKGDLLNRAFYKVNVKRFGFVFILYFIISEILIDFFYMNIVGNSFWSWGGDSMQARYLFLDYMGYYYFFTVFALAIIMGLVLFSYINNEKALTSLHSMPVSRKSLYFTNYAVFTSMLGVVLFVHFVFVSIHLVFKGYLLSDFIGYMILKYIVIMILGISVFAFTTFIGMLVSNFIIQFGLLVVFLGLPALLIQLFLPIATVLLNGFTIDINSVPLDLKMMPYYFLYKMMRFFPYEDVSTSASLEFISIDFLSLGLAIIFLILSVVFGYILYQKRRLEACHDLIAFKWAKKIIVVIISIILALIFANIVGVIGSLANEYKPVLFYLGAGIGMFLGYIIMKMIAEKSLRMHKFFLGGLISSAIILVLMFVIDLDLFGFEKYVPRVDEVETAYVYSSYYPMSEFVIEQEYGFVENGYSGYGTNDNRIVKISGTEDIYALRDKHLAIVKNVSEGNEFRTKNIYISYVLKSGKTVIRSYGLIDEDLSEYMTYFKGFESNKKALSEDFDKDILYKDYTQGFVYNTGTGMLPISKDERNEFLRLYKLDLLDYMTDKNNVFVENQSTLDYEQMPVVARISLVSNYAKNNRVEYRVADSFDRSIKWLKENGYSDVFGEDNQLSDNPDKKTSVFKISRIEVFSLKENGEFRQLFKIFDEVMIDKFLLYKEKLSDNVVSADDELGFVIYYHNEDGSVEEMKVDKMAQYLIMSILEDILLSNELER